MSSHGGRGRLTDLAGRVAFITGGSSGIGLGIACSCLDAGMKVILTYRTVEHLRAAFPSLRNRAGSFECLDLDVTSRNGLEAAASYVRDSYGNVNLLIANAGVGVSTPITEVDYEEWDFSCGVNIDGVFNTIHCFLPSMIAGGEPAHVMSTASMSGLFHGSNVGVYTTTKFAVVGMMEALRAELCDHEIGVSVCCPGLVSTRIYLSRRNRASGLCTPRPSAEESGREARYREMMAAGMDPLECGRKILVGVLRNDMYILTHPEYRQGIKDRCDKLLASISRDGETAPADRIQAESRVLRHRIYSSGA